MKLYQLPKAERIKIEKRFKTLQSKVNARRDEIHRCMNLLADLNYQQEKEVSEIGRLLREYEGLSWQIILGIVN